MGEVAATNQLTINDWIPCGKDVRADSSVYLPSIVRGILDGCASGDWHKLLRKSVHALKRYMDLKHTVPVKERALIINALYRVVTEEDGLDQYLQKIFAQQLVRLLKKRGQEKLDIVLDWRPLYRVIDFLFFGKARIPQTPLCPYLGYYIICLARSARHYFNKESVGEIVNHLRPFFCAQHTASCLKGQVMLTLLMKRTEDVDFRLLKEIMSIWGWVVAYADWDLHWMVLLASLCRYTYRTRSSDWKVFIPSLMSHILHIIDLPVGVSRIHIYGNMESSLSSPEGSPFYSLASFVHLDDNRTKILQLVHKSAKLIIYLQQPGGGEPLGMLGKIIRAIESYLHPSNGGYWTHRLSQLLASLCEYLMERVRAERDVADSESYKLKPSDISNIARLILPVALQGLYSKSNTATLQSCVALKYLASLDPNNTLPPLLDRISDALTTLTQVHQTSSALEALAAVIFPVIRAGNFESGAKHIPDLMELTLSGIDSNDLPKTWATLRFYTVLLSGLPLITITETCPVGYDPDRHEVARAVTDTFADWAFRFLDQTFSFISNHNSMAPPQGHEHTKKADSETRTSEYFFNCTLEVFFMQLGDELFVSALNKVANFCFTNLLLLQQQAQLGVVISAMTAVNPSVVAQKFLPVCLRILLVSPYDSVPRTPRTPGSARSFTRAASASKSPGLSWASPPMTHGMGSVDVESPMLNADGKVEGVVFRLALLSEMEIIYYLNIMRYVVENAGDAVIPYIDKVVAAVDLVLKYEERPGVISLQVFKAANKLIRSLIHALITCRPKEYRSVDPTLWNDPNWKNVHYEHWGNVIDLSAANVSWNAPSREGLQWAADLAAKYINNSVQVLRRYHADAQEWANHKEDMEVEAAQPKESDEGSPSPCVLDLNSDNDIVMMDSDAAADEAVEPAQKQRKSQSKVAFAKLKELEIPAHILSSQRQSCRRSSLRGFSDRAKRKDGSRGSPTSIEARYAVLQMRFVLEGLVAALPAWDEGREDSSEMQLDGDLDDDERELLPGNEGYASGTYDLPKSRVDVSNIGKDGLLSRSRIASILHDLNTLFLQQNSEDSKMLKALAKCLDVCMNGVDILQKQTRRLRLRYSIMKARNRETGTDGKAKLLPRYMLLTKIHHHYLSRVMLRHRKLHDSLLVQNLLKQVNLLSTNEHSGVRGRGQLALLSCCRRYRNACAYSLPRLISLLEDKNVDAAGHEQRIIGATILLQTKYFQGRILRDWSMIEHFLLTLCRSHHNDKESVLDALDNLFATFLSYWYQISLDIPAYVHWDESLIKLEQSTVPFVGYSRMLEALVALLKTNPNVHWRFKLMIIDAVTVMIRDDVPTPISVWEAILDGMVSDISHIREACFPALSSALELIQTTQRSKEESLLGNRLLPDKCFTHWNGPPPKASFTEWNSNVRKKVVTKEYSEQVRACIMQYFCNDEYIEKLCSFMSVVQLGRGKSFIGSHAQMFKGLLKAFGLQVITKLRTFLEALLADAQAYSHESSDVYIGKQCLASELLGGLVRGMKYWPEQDQEEAKGMAFQLISYVLATPELESVGIWAACLRFCLYDRHPRRTSWLVEFLVERALPAHIDLSSHSILTCKRIILVKPILKELGWRGGPIHRQIAHDLEPYLHHPYAQMRACVGSILSVLSRVTWEPREFASMPSPADAEHLSSEQSHHMHLLCCSRQAGMSELLEAPPHTECKLIGSETMLRLVDKCAREWSTLANRCKYMSDGKNCSDEAEEQAMKDSRVQLRHLRHTLITWTCSVCPEYEAMYRCPVESFLPILLPPLLQALDDKDPELLRQAKGCAELTANTPIVDEVLPHVLLAVRSVSKSQSWQVRSSVLPFLQIIIFRHQCSIRKEDMKMVQDLMVSLLQDSQVEVREMASVAVSVLVRITGEELAMDLKTLFVQWSQHDISSMQGRAGEPVDDAREGKAGEDSSDKKALKASLQLRHAGVLGLSALVGAYPYDVPQWMPEILVQLALHVLDPMPIKHTVRNTFGEFWRTHQDAWPVLKGRFTEEQLTALTNLLASPTYFS